MKRKHIGLISTSFLLLAACTDMSQNPNEVSTQDLEQLPVFRLAENGVQSEQVQRLMNELGVQAEIGEPNPFAPINYLDTEKFMAVPSKVVGQEKSEEDGGVAVTEAFDFKALQKVKPFDAGEAVERMLGALDSAKLLPEYVIEGVSAEPYTDVSTFSLETTEGQTLINAEVDTHVLFNLRLEQAGGVPLSGPGGKVKAVFNPEGQVTQLYYGLYGLEQIGETSVLSADSAAQACEEAYASNEGLLPGTPKLTYYVDSPDQNGEELTPSYACEDYTLKSGVQLRAVMLDASTGEPRGESALAAQFTDSRGSRKPTLSTQRLGRVDVGVEYIGVSQGLGGSKKNAGGFADAMRGGGVPVQFHFGDAAAWERDFKDPSEGGADNAYVDDVDITFYTGHADGNGFTFEGTNDDGFLHYNDAKWGNRDLEWLVVAACGPLQHTSGGKNFAQRWGPAFKGLHQMLAYANVSFDNQIEGRLLAEKMLGKKISWFPDKKPQKVRQAWVATATEVQPSSVTWAVMGPVSNSKYTNYDDYFHGKGSVSTDIDNPNTFWRIAGPS